MIAPPLTGAQIGILLLQTRKFKISTAAENAMAK